MPLLRSGLFSIALLACVGSHAAGVNCSMATGRVESLICDDADLSDSDKVLNATYAAVMEAVAKPGAMRSEQVRWLRQVRDRCPDAGCLQRVYDERIAALEAVWQRQFVAAGRARSAQALRGAPLEGEWQQCQLYRGQVICSSYTLVQQGSRVCGAWDYWATHRIYNGQLQATVGGTPDQAQVQQVCGTPGSLSQTDCDNDVPPRGRWEAAQGVLALCAGQLVVTEGSTTPPVCDARARAAAWVRQPVAGRAVADLRKQAWVQQCLTPP